MSEGIVAAQEFKLRSLVSAVLPEKYVGVPGAEWTQVGRFVDDVLSLRVKFEPGLRKLG
jgi:hypothetical protein